MLFGYGYGQWQICLVKSTENFNNRHSQTTDSIYIYILYVSGHLLSQEGFQNVTFCR